jgi:eukaryotic-like serine/threonine-protein kinase
MPVLNSEPETERTPTASPRIDSVIGKWRIDSKLGNGTTAYVYAATSTKDGQRAAIKILRVAHVDDATRRRFAREGYVANAVGHPGVVRIFDQGITDDGALFIVMELLAGESLESLRLRRGGSLPIDRAVDIGCELLEIVAAAHARNITHRDLKPANVFVGSDGAIKVLDFGLANISQPDRASSITRSGVVIGTPAFMPPEQVRGRRSEVDARSDVWALGATLFTLITGRAVHVAASTSGQMLAALTKPAPPLQSVAPQVSTALASVIDRALAFERKDRWEDADAMGKALRAARSSGLESSTPVVTNHEGATPIADGIPSLADDGDDVDAPTRVAGYAALALLTSPAVHPDVVIKEQTLVTYTPTSSSSSSSPSTSPPYEALSLAPAQRTLPPTPESRSAAATVRSAPPWFNAVAGVCAALVAGGITLAAIVSAERIRTRPHATTAFETAPAQPPPVVLDAVPEAPASAPIVVEPLPVAEEPAAAPTEVAANAAPPPQTTKKIAPPQVAPAPAPPAPSAIPVVAAADDPASPPSPAPSAPAHTDEPAPADPE